MQRDFEYVTIAQLKDGTWRVCVEWQTGDPLHCYTLDKAATVAADARKQGNEDLSAELHEAIRDAIDATSHPGPGERSLATVAGHGNPTAD